MGKVMEFHGEIQGFHAEIMQDWHGGALGLVPLCGQCHALRPVRLPRKAVETLELPGWLQPVTTLSLVVSLVLSCNLSSDSSDANPPWPLAMLAVEPQKYHGGTPLLMLFAF